MVAIVTLGVVLNSWMGTVQRQVLSYATDIGAQGLLDGTNAQRTNNGLGALRLNSQLSQAAQAKAADMVAENYWAHTSPSGKTPWTFIAASGYSYTTAGENLAYGFTTSSETISGWMNSAGHRANILNSAYSDVGFGIVNAEDYQSNGNQTIVVAMYAAPYATPVATATPAQSTLTKQTANTTIQDNQSASASGEQEEQTQDSSNDTAVTEKQDTAVPVSSTAKGEESSTDTSQSKPISRVQVITAANVAWTQFALSMLVSVAILVFLLRHSFAWHKFLVRGERFVLHHPLLDIAFVAIATLGTILLQTAGFIR